MSDKNLYGQKDDLGAMTRWVERSNTHSGAPITEAPQGHGDLPDATQRSQDPGDVSELEKGG
jgi:hypothetical protein